MGFWLDEDTYQFSDLKEMAASLGIDLETMEADYAEAYHHLSRHWDKKGENAEAYHHLSRYWDKN
jgi:hypothetical protein